MAKALTSDIVASMTGYSLTPLESTVIPENLTQCIFVLGEPNTDKTSVESYLDFSTATEVAEEYGYGSYLHLMALTLRPTGSDRLGTLKTIIVPQTVAAGATANIVVITPAGTATENGTVYIQINDRTVFNNKTLAVNIAIDDTVADITAAIESAVNAVTAAPFGAVDGTTIATLTSKWKGLTSNQFTVTVSGTVAGVTFGVATTDGAGLPEGLLTSLEGVSDIWGTLIVSPYNLTDNAAELAILKTWIGNPIDRTGRYVSTKWKPAVALIGNSTLTQSAIETALTTMGTNKNAAFSIVSASGSTNCDGIISAAYAESYVAICNENPEEGMENTYVRDGLLTAPSVTPQIDFGDPTTCNENVVSGISNTLYVDGVGYLVKDFVTVYSNTEELVASYSLSRMRYMMIDFNVKFVYEVTEKLNLIGKVIIPDGQPTSKDSFTRPILWKATVYQLLSAFALRGWIADLDYAQGTVSVAISSSNANRFDTEFSYKRTGSALVSSTDVSVGFYYGS